jgi:hypothetical protein
MSTAADNRFYREVPTTRDDGGPAFPVEVGTRPVGQNWHQTGNDTAQHYGLSLRDFFAAKAMAAMCSGTWPDSDERREIVKRAYAMADEMLIARNA